VKEQVGIQVVIGLAVRLSSINQQLAYLYIFIDPFEPNCCMYNPGQNRLRKARTACPLFNPFYMIKFIHTYSIQFIVLFLVLYVPAVTAVTFEEPQQVSDEFRPFITTWKTDNEGASNDNQVRVPMIGDGYDFTVDWGDGSEPQDHSANPGIDVVHFKEHTYAESGTYTISITGTFPRIYFFNAGDREKILSVEQWGDIEWTSMERAFNGASNLNIHATDAPDLSEVQNMSQMFNLASSINADLNHWDTSTITDMRMAFRRASQFNGKIESWDTGNVTDMSNMFIEAEAFNQDIGRWDVGEVTTMAAMFREAKAFNRNIGSWDTGKVTNMNNMFRDAENFNQDISLWNTAAVDNMSGMFMEAATFNQDISGWNTGSLGMASQMFRNASAFDQDLGGWDMGSVWVLENYESTSGLGEILSNSGLSTKNYDATLSGWAAFVEGNNGPADIVLGADGLTYCKGADTRKLLVDNYNWTINDAGSAVDCIPTDLEMEDVLPRYISLHQNYPNPFNPSTLINFDLPEAGYARVVIYDLMGRSVQTLADGHLSAGSHQVSFDAGRLSSGAYLYRLETAGFTATRKMMLVK